MGFDWPDRTRPVALLPSNPHPNPDQVLDMAFKLHPWLYKPVKSAYYEENISKNRR